MGGHGTKHNDKTTESGPSGDGDSDNSDDPFDRVSFRGVHSVSWWKLGMVLCSNCLASWVPTFKMHSILKLTGRSPFLSTTGQTINRAILACS